MFANCAGRRTVDKKKSMKKNIIMTCALLFLTGCISKHYHSVKDFSKKQLYHIQTDCFAAEYLNPQKIEWWGKNARFCGGAWLLRLKKKEGKNLFYSQTATAGHHNYGMPLEFTHAIPLGDDHYLRLGVGIVKREKNAKPFFDKIARRFPWRSKIERKGKCIVIHYNQFAPDYYFYTIDVAFNEASNKIIYTHRFINLSLNEISSPFYWHPFFIASSEKISYVFNNAEKRFIASDKNSFYSEEIFSNGGKITVSDGENEILSFEIPHLKKIGIWRQKTADMDVFAVEPFGEMKVKPFNETSWTWSIIVH
jgi:hypothetical protein